MRRRPVAAYRVIDEEELLGGADPGAEWEQAAPEWPCAEPMAPRRGAPWRPAAVLATVVVAAGAFALVGKAASWRAPAVQPSSAARDLASFGVAATAPEPPAGGRGRGRQEVPRATVLAPPRARSRPSRRPRSPARGRHARRPAGRKGRGRVIRRLATRAGPAPPLGAPTGIGPPPVAPSPAGEFGFER